ncbi:MAG: flavodoxin domain-containing protein [Nitrososphaerota archaeon]
MSNNKTLIAYVTKGGATKEAAYIIANILKDKYGFDVDLINLMENPNPDLKLYKNVIIGYGVRAQRVYREALDFLKRNDLKDKKVAIFILSLEAGNPKSYENAIKKYIKNVLEKYPNVKPIAIEAFGGRIRILGFNIVNNFNIEKIKVWTEELGKELKE